jgi:shikimate 5-dehydrogenase
MDYQNLQEQHKKWRQDALNASNEKIKNTMIMQDNLLKERPNVENTKRTSSYMFGTNKDCSTDNNNVFGSGGITQSLAMSYKDKEESRKKIIERRSEGFDRLREQNVDSYVDKTSATLSSQSSNRLQMKILLDSISTRILNDNIDLMLFQDLYKYIQFLVKDIVNYDDYETFNELISTFRTLGENVKTVIQEARLQLLRGKKDDTLDTKYLKSIFDIINGIIEYLKFNTKGIGKDMNTRKTIAKAGIKRMKLDQAQKLIEKTKEGKIIINNIEAEMAAEEQEALKIARLSRIAELDNKTRALDADMKIQLDNLKQQYLTTYNVPVDESSDDYDTLLDIARAIIDGTPQPPFPTTLIQQLDPILENTKKMTAILDIIKYIKEANKLLSAAGFDIYRPSNAIMKANNKVVARRKLIEAGLIYP